VVNSSFSRNVKAPLSVLRRFEEIDASPQASLDSITALVAWFFNSPISVINLILQNRIIVKSVYGLEKAQVGHQAEWCAEAIATDDVFCITDALEHPLAKADPLVAGEFGLRFYAAAPLRTLEGHCIGILCVIDRKPRNISVLEKEFLMRMAALVINLIESHLTMNCLRSLIGESKQQQLAWLADRVTGDSPAIQKARELLRLAIIRQADSVLLVGETGTGKGVCALAIHEGSGARGRFIEVNCAALPHDLIESELFGHEKGSFTAATDRKIGLFEHADGGTIFLGEIAELPPDLQDKLLTVLERRELRRVGGAQAIPVDVRVIAATNRPLESALSDGAFCHNLFLQIGSWCIEIPALRDRGDDVTLLARHFIAELGKSKGYRVEDLAPEAEDLLKQYDWPGNVRQLLNVIRRAIMLENGNVISPETIHHMLEEEKKLVQPAPPTAPRLSYKDLKRILITEAEARLITGALARNRNNKTKTAKELGLTRGQLDYRLKLLERMTGR